jgi:predicted regulator of Ras-like GTPase activity (Roadblock/LC7/MglB family)
MRSLTDILQSLCEGKDMGALVITKDGMVIESLISDDYERETLSAFMSQVALMIKNPLAQLGHDGFSRYVMESNQGRVFLVDLGQAVLIALTGVDVKIEDLNVAIYQAANEIKKTGRIDV